MKIFLTIILIITFNFSTFAQIDTSAWEGKTVLVVLNQKYSPKHINYYNNLNQGFTKNWYLTDSIHFIADTLIKQDLNDFGEDTVIIVWKTDWQKLYANKYCISYTIPEDCVIWVLTEHFEFKNFQSNNWETYVFPFSNEALKPVQKFQELISSSRYSKSYENKKIIIKNQFWSKDIEQLIQEKFNDFKIVQDQNNDYASYKGNDAIFIYQQFYSKTNYIEIVDLKTNRVIEKIKIK
ncbi:MAG: hypothetical protein AB8G11_03920 [Saprospiraceae bacterium]